MKAALALAIAMTGAGCDFVFGLDEVVAPESLDAASLPRVTGRLSERYVTNNTSGMPVVLDRTYEPEAIGIAVTLADGTTPEVEYRADGTFEFERADPRQLYRLVFTTDGARNEYQLDVPEVTIERFAAGRPSPAVVQSSSLQFGYKAAEAGLVGAQLASTGVFMTLSTGQFGPTVTADWKTANVTGASREGLLDASEGDRMYVLELHYDSTTRPGLNYASISGASSAAITQIPAKTTVLPTPVAVTRNACAHLVTPNATELRRITTAVPARSYTYLGGDWYIFGVPSNELGLTAALPLAYAGEVTALDSDHTIPFYEPFPGWGLVAQAGALAGFDTPIPGSTQPLRLYNAVRRYRVLGHGPIDCSQAPLPLSGTAALPDGITLAGKALDVDDKPVTLGDGDVEVTWQNVLPGSVDLMTAAVYEIVGSPEAASIVGRRAAVVLAPRAVFDRSLFVSGKRYVIAVTNSVGRPGAASGDFATLAPALETAVTWSHTFLVP